MPNWTWNNIFIEGEERDIQRFLEAVGANEEEQTFTFDTLVPQPADINELPEGPCPDYPSLTLPGWYLWRREHWGTKWNADDPWIEGGPGNRSMGFATAWDAPRAYAEAFVAKGNEIGVAIRWDCTHEDGMVEETIVKPVREAV